MTAIEKAIRESVRGGFRPKWFEKTDEQGLDVESYIAHVSIDIEYECDIFLEPAFWQALGSVRGWKHAYKFEERSDRSGEGWLIYWHMFIDHLAEGKDAESFFAD